MMPMEAMRTWKPGFFMMVKDPNLITITQYAKEPENLGYYYGKWTHIWVKITLIWIIIAYLRSQNRWS